MLLRLGCLAAAALLSGQLLAGEPVHLQERFPVGCRYHVSSRLHLTGELILPPDKDNPKGQTLPVTGHSAIDYDERVLEADGGGPTKTVRVFQRIDFQRKIGKEEQDNTIRPEVRRLVLLRRNFVEVPFSPDGPLTHAELDLVRTDVFTPALAGLLPADAVRPGDTWKASAASVVELTDMEKIEEGSLHCKFEEIVAIAGRKQARVALNGSIRGINEDGPNRQEVAGFYYFDLGSNHLSYLSLQGKQSLLDKDGKVTGTNEGTFTLARQVNFKSEALSDTALHGVRLEPTAANTLLLYDNLDIGVRFQYSRRWRVGSVQGRQLLIDDGENKGNGILLTMENAKSTPTPAQYLQETQTFVREQRGRVLGVQQPREIARNVFQFAIEAELGGQKLLLDYYVARHAEGGATLAARILPADIGAVRPEVERIAKTLTIGKK